MTISMFISSLCQCHLVALSGSGSEALVGVVGAYFALMLPLELETGITLQSHEGRHRVRDRTAGRKAGRR